MTKSMTGMYHCKCINLKIYQPIFFYSCKGKNFEAITNLTSFEHSDNKGAVCNVEKCF